jgi:hypothetical protein
MDAHQPKAVLHKKAIQFQLLDRGLGETATRAWANVIHVKGHAESNVVHAEDTTQLQRRMEALRKWVDSGQFRKDLETPNLSFMLLAHFHGNQSHRCACRD